ncbi:MAG TPA: hypothetical protein VMT62_02925 [Syntrophorhabdaceae bacterium]|nr:hypothetical protein [Syntrophorhabdaceae bacterium]
MSRRTFVLVCFLSFLVVFGESALARADNIVRWTFVNAYLTNGGSITGFFDMDYTGGTRVVNWDITAGGGVEGTSDRADGSGAGLGYTVTIYYPITHFTPSNSYQDPEDMFHFCTVSFPVVAATNPDRVSFYTGVPNNWTAPSSSDPTSWTSGIYWTTAYEDYHANDFYVDGAFFGGGERNVGIASGGSLTASAVPVPAPLLLFAPGLASLAAVRRRFRK